MKPCLTGSSPLIRGKRGPNHSIGAQSGLIPAHAGKTSRSECLGRRAGAHPRSRGENAERGAQILGYLGSSPLMRGIPDGRLSQNYQAGLIPAHAGKRMGRTPKYLTRRLIPTHEGKTLSGRSWLASRPAHPRSRGENDDGTACGDPS